MAKIIKNKHFVIKDGVYNSCSDIIIGDNDFFIKFLKRNKINGHKINPSWCAETGVFYNNNGSLAGNYIRLPNISFTNEDYKTIVHELSHLTFNILKQVGVKYGANNQEPYAYLLESLLGKFLEKAIKLYK